MSFVFVTSVAFVGGMVCSLNRDWRYLVAIAAVSGFVTGIAGRALGVA